MTGFVLLRLRAHRLLVAAALLSSLLVTTALASLAAYAHTTAEAGVRRALEHQSASRTVLTASARVSAQDRKSIDAGVRTARQEGLRRAAGAGRGRHPLRLLRAARRPASRRAAAGRPPRPHPVRLDRPAPGRDGRGHLARHRARRGRRPRPSPCPSRPAKRLGLNPGDDLRLTSRLSDPRGPRAGHRPSTGPRSNSRRTGGWTRSKATAVRTLDYTTYGPLAVAPDAFAGAALPSSEVYWLADGDFSGVDVGRLSALRDHFAHAVQRFSKQPHTGGAVAQSELPTVLDGLQRSLLSNRSTLLVAALQLVFLAVLTLLLVAQLLTSERAAETETLQARGASRARLAAFSGIEALLVALPGAVLGPLLAVPVVHLLLTQGALGRTGVDSSVRLTPLVWWVATVAAFACALAVVAPSLRRPPATVTKRRSRHGGAVVRGGADLALAVLAAVALWQLLERSSGAGVLSANSAGGADGQSLSIDPVLVVAPALALLAGTVLAMRLLPLIGRFGERRAARGPGLAGALAGWQLARRPGYGSGPALLLVLAVAMAVLAVGEGASWDRSQTDQADFRTGGDVTTTSSTLPVFGQGGMFTGIDGVAAAVPVARDEFTVRGDRTTQVVATDTRAAGHMLHLREDLSAHPLAALLKPLAHGGASEKSGIPLPAHTAKLRFALRLAAAHGRAVSAPGVPELSVTLLDRFGVPYTFRLGELPGDGGRHTLTLDLAAAAGEGGTPAGPLRLTRLSLRLPGPRKAADARLILDGLTAARADGETGDVPLPDGGTWQAALDFRDDQNLMTDAYGPPKLGAVRQGPERRRDSTLRYTTGSAPPPGRLRRTRPDARASRRVLRAALRGTGSAPCRPPWPPTPSSTPWARTSATPSTSRSAASELTVKVSGSLRATAHHRPGAGPRRRRRAHCCWTWQPWTGHWPRETSRRCHRRAGGCAPTTAGPPTSHTTCGRTPPWSTVLVRDELAEQLRSDPLTAGPRAALVAISLAAAVFAGAGCAVSAVRAAEEREGGVRDPARPGGPAPSAGPGAGRRTGRRAHAGTRGRTAPRRALHPVAHTPAGVDRRGHHRRARTAGAPARRALWPRCWRPFWRCRCWSREPPRCAAAIPWPLCARNGGTDPMDPSGRLAWCRARLRTAPWAAVAFAALVLVTAFTAAVLPRASTGLRGRGAARHPAQRLTGGEDGQRPDERRPVRRRRLRRRRRRPRTPPQWRPAVDALVDPRERRRRGEAVPRRAARPAAPGRPPPGLRREHRHAGRGERPRAATAHSHDRSAGLAARPAGPARLTRASSTGTGRRSRRAARRGRRPARRGRADPAHRPHHEAAARRHLPRRPAEPEARR